MSNIYEWSRGTGCYLLIFKDLSQIPNPFQISSLLQKKFYESSVKLDIQSAIIQGDQFTILFNHGVLGITDIYEFNGHLSKSTSKVLVALYGKNTIINFQMEWHPNIKN